MTVFAKVPWLLAFGALTFVLVYLLSLTPSYPAMKWIVFGVLTGLSFYHVEQFKEDVDGETKTKWVPLTISMSLYGVFGVVGGNIGLKVFAV